MSSNSKEIAKLKKKYSKWPWETGISGLKNWLLQNMPVVFVLWLLRKLLVKSDYKLKRESIKFFMSSNIAYGASRIRRCDRLLAIGLRLIDQNLPDSYIGLIRNATRSALHCPENRVELTDTVLLGTRQLKVSLLDATSWYQLSRGLFSLGFFRAAWIARENSLDNSILETLVADASVTTLYRGIQAHFERGEIIEVDKILLESGRLFSSKISKLIRESVSLLQGDPRGSAKIVSLQNSPNCDYFFDLINGRSVAIVGPGVPQGDYGKEIDEFDTVIRIKFIGSEMLDGKNLHGSKTDISYLGAVSELQLQEIGIRKEHENLKLILCSDNSRNSISLIPIFEIGRDNILYRTPTTSGLRTLYEVLKFSPSKIKIYGFDFYATLIPYSAEMTAFYERSSWKFGHPNDFIEDGVYLKFARARDFSNHDPVSNFCFAQNLYKAGLFDIEPYGKSILELTPYQYVERLEEMLGDW